MFQRSSETEVAVINLRLWPRHSQNDTDCGQLRRRQRPNGVQFPSSISYHGKVNHHRDAAIGEPTHDGSSIPRGTSDCQLVMANVGSAPVNRNVKPSQEAKP